MWNRVFPMQIQYLLSRKTCGVGILFSIQIDPEIALTGNGVASFMSRVMAKYICLCVAKEKFKRCMDLFI